MAERRTEAPFREELPRLLQERGLSIRQLAGLAEVEPSHLSRLLRGADYRKTPSADLLRRIAVALRLPEDYFPEFREAAVIEAVRLDPQLRERIYRRLR